MYFYKKTFAYAGVFFAFLWHLSLASSSPSAHSWPKGEEVCFWRSYFRLSSLFVLALAFGSLLAKVGRSVFLAELFLLVFSLWLRARLRLTLGQRGKTCVFGGVIFDCLLCLSSRSPSAHSWPKWRSEFLVELFLLVLSVFPRACLRLTLGQRRRDLFFCGVAFDSCCLKCGNKKDLKKYLGSFNCI